MNKIALWASAMRAPTLLLSFTGFLLGSLIAFSKGFFDWRILVFGGLTAMALQALSNLANDYGDFITGVDSPEMKGGKRPIVDGLINIKQLKKAVFISAIVSFVLGLILVFSAFSINETIEIIIFIALGLFAIWSAIAYTMGKKPYGYSGFGDLSVLLFFGIVPVLGAFYLQTKSIDYLVLLPALSLGLLVVAVLNINNVRDITNDIKFDKRTTAIMLGDKKARNYQLVLVYSAIVLSLIYTFINYINAIQNNILGWIWIIIMLTA